MFAHTHTHTEKRATRVSLSLPLNPPPPQSLSLSPQTYIRSNLWSRRENTSAMAVELEIMHTARCTLARSPPGTTVGGW
jgi:hypothetical protein